MATTLCDICETPLEFADETRCIDCVEDLSLSDADHRDYLASITD